MSKCKSFSIPMRGTKRQDKNVNVAVWVAQSLESCFTSTTEKPIIVEGDPYEYDKRDRPADMFNCSENLCVNSGTMWLTMPEPGGADPVQVNATYQIPGNALDIETGAMTFYVTAKGDQTLKLDIKVSDFLDTVQANADVYNIQLALNGTSTEEITVPVVIRFDTLPTSVIGTGWEASNRGIVVSFTGTNTDNPELEKLGISSISLYDSIEELEVNDLVLLSCVDTFTQDFTFDTTDAACLGSSYDKDAFNFENTLDVRKSTANDYKLNPLAIRGEKTDGFFPTTVKRTIESIIFNNITYGFIQLLDIDEDVCGFDLVHVGECNTPDGLLKRVENWYSAQLNSDQYSILTSQVNDTEKGVFLFNEELIGEEATIFYPKKVENILHIVGTDEFMDERKVKVLIIKEYSDNTKDVLFFNNVIITGISGDGWSSTEETVKTITFRYERDYNNNFFEIFRIQKN